MKCTGKSLIKTKFWMKKNNILILSIVMRLIDYAAQNSFKHEKSECSVFHLALSSFAISFSILYYLPHYPSLLSVHLPKHQSKQTSEGRGDANATIHSFMHDWNRCGITLRIQLWMRSRELGPSHPQASSGARKPLRDCRNVHLFYVLPVIM